MRYLKRDKDTICALATPEGAGAISVIRVSGEKAAEITRRVAPFLPAVPESHRVYFGYIKDLKTGSSVDQVLITYFAHGRSFTGEETLEISCHGSEYLVAEILRQLMDSGARMAERGEFTYRAFMNGRMDLVQAESVLALIQSRSKRASQLALRQLTGELSRRLQSLTESLTWVLANLEANIDFASEDIEIASNETLLNRTEKVFAALKELLAGYRAGRIIQKGFVAAIVGAPNAGKSSLLNALVEEERAIVTDVPGTTRDFIQAEVDFEGTRLSLIDTAGLRITEDLVEKIGIERTLQVMNQADAVLFVYDAHTPEPLAETFQVAIPWDRTLTIANKVDLVESSVRGWKTPSDERIQVSARSGRGLEELRNWLRAKVKAATGEEDSCVISQARQYEALERAKEYVEQGVSLLKENASPDLIALELQLGLKEIYSVLGWTYDDQVMDSVFKQFCLGK